MKKRLFALMLVVAMVMGMSMTTMAATDYESTPADTFKITKTYTSTETFVPGEVLSFEIVADASNPDTSKLISIGTEDKFTVTGLTNDITVNVPSYDKVGTYNYTITEVEGNTAGVTYDTAEALNVAIQVVYDNAGDKLVVASKVVKDAAGDKASDFANDFATGDFTVAKDVDGNMANENDEFEITVTLTSEKEILTDISFAGKTVTPSMWTDGVYTDKITISESDGPQSFLDIPVGVQVKVEETNAKGYTVIDGEESFTVAKENAAVVIKNEQKVDIATGIIVNNFPYIIALAAVAVALVAFMRRRRSF